MCSGDGRDDASAGGLGQPKRDADTEESSDTPGSRDQDHADTAPKGEAWRPDAPKADDKGRKAEADGRQAKRQPEPAKSVEIAGVVISLVTGIVAACGVWISHGQLRAMNQQLSDAELAASEAANEQAMTDARQDDALAASEKIAAAAKTEADSMSGIAAVGRDQLGAAQDTARRQLRAYPAVLVDRVSNFGEGKTPHTEATIQNTGQTPVYNERWLSGFGVFDHPVRTFGNPPPCSKIGDDAGPHQAFFAREATSEKDGIAPLTRQQVAAVTGGTADLVFIGRLCFTDIYKATRHVDFCYFWHDSGAGLGSALQCNGGNDAN